MVAQSAGKANRDLTWPALTGKRELRGSTGIGLSVACWIAEELRFAVVPMWPIAKMEGRKVPLEKWKELEYRTPLEIRRDSKFRMKCGVAVLAGKSGLVVIDVDDEDSWDEFVGMQDMPATMELSTHSGRQLIFRDDTGITFKTQGGQLAQGVDVRGRGGLFVVYDPGQPERHFTDLTEPAELPGWLRAAIPLAGSRGHRKGSAPPKQKVDIEAIVRGIPPGQHHDRLNALALALVNRGGISDQAWYDLAKSVLANSREGTDGKGNARDPFSDAEIMDFLHTAQDKRRAEIADKRANPGKEYEDAEITISAADVPDEDVEWVWSRYIPRCSFTQIDGEKGYAKSFTLADIVARATTGRAMPGEEESICDPMHVLIFTEELLAQNKKKLRAAGADLSMVHYPHPEFREAILRMLEKKHGNVTEAMEEAGTTDLDYLLPTGTDVILGMIRKNHAELVIWDPISHYVDADVVNVNSDPAVRRALEPLMRGLNDMNAAGIMVRHMNKDRGAAARHRGSGTTAFQNVGRVHLVMGRLADENEDCGTFGLSMVANNYTVTVHGTLAFDVVDSDIKLDKLGHYVGKVEWRELEEDIDAETLVRGSGDGGSSTSGKRGPAPAKRQAVKRILAEMEKIKQVWDAVEAWAHVNAEMEKLFGDKPNERTVRDAMQEAMVVSKRVDVGKNEWTWPAQRVPRVRQ